MLSRRILRIKILQSLYSHFASGRSVIDSEKELFFSINKSFDLFFYLLQAIIDIRFFAEQKIEAARMKKIPSKEDLHPNTRFIDCKLLQQIQNNKIYVNYLKNKNISWANYPEIIKGLLAKTEKFSVYREFMEKDKPGYDDEKHLIGKILTDIIASNELVMQHLEEQSIFWNVEIEFVVSILLKSIKKYVESAGEEYELISVVQNSEDMDFVSHLFRKTISAYDNNLKLIEKYTKNWDVDRIAFIDTLVLQMAITELVEFPFIPKKVSFNEYIDIAKIFSTKNSGQFVNGVLDKIVEFLISENKIVKQGRGLKE